MKVPNVGDTIFVTDNGGYKDDVSVQGFKVVRELIWVMEDSYCVGVDDKYGSRPSDEISWSVCSQYITFEG